MAQARPGQIVRALTWHSFRSAFGFGRGVKAKVVPILAIIAICLPSLVNAFAVARGNAAVRLRRVFPAAASPRGDDLHRRAGAGTLSRDLRSQVLPLYFTRPLRRGDYPLAKYIALTAAILLLVEVPLLILYPGTIASAKNTAGVWRETKALIPGLALGLLWAVLMAAVGLVLRPSPGGGRTRPASSRSPASSPSPVHGADPGRAPTPHVDRRPDRRAISPFTVLDGVRIRLGGTRTGGPPIQATSGRSMAPGHPDARGQPRGPGREVPEGKPGMTIEFPNSPAGTATRWRSTTSR